MKSKKAPKKRPSPKQSDTQLRAFVKNKVRPWLSGVWPALDKCLPNTPCDSKYHNAVVHASRLVEQLDELLV